MKKQNLLIEKLFIESVNANHDLQEKWPIETRWMREDFGDKAETVRIHFVSNQEAHLVT